MSETKSKLVFLFAGQLRTFDNVFVKKSWDKFFDLYDVLVYGCFWNKRGKSAYSNGMDSDENEIIDIKKVKEIFRTDNIKLYDYNDFESQLKPDYLKFKNSHHFGCSISHSYLRSMVCKMMISDGIDLSFDPITYTLIRPDLIWLTEPPSCLTTKTNLLWHNDSPQAYHPNRIYDIFMCSNRINILKMGLMHDDTSGFLAAIDSNFNSDLGQLDSCRLYYNYSVLNKIEIKSQEKLHIDVFRSNNDIDYYKNVYTKNPIWGVT